ncbi:uncharacterized protein [Littorina saxatilis]|uniref:uncharacterized protein n=1 Tax=Littorina saxatilis TaxID=31220 RepID=UPI0038B67CF4
MKDLCLLLATVVSLSFINCQDGPTGGNLQINLTQTLDVTSGRHHYELSCADPGVSPTPVFRWFNVNCSNGGQGSTCTFEPNATQHNIQPECISKRVIANETERVFQTIRINFAYPVLQGPQSGSPRSDLLHTGDNLTCSLTTSKPLEGSVHFACTDPTLDDQPDANNATSVSSSVTVNAALATEKDTECICHATLNIGNGFYHISTAALFTVEHKAKIKSLTLNGTDRDITVNESNNATLQLVCNAFGRPGPAEFTLDWVNRESPFTNVTITEMGKWTSQAAVTLSDIQCRDMGTYSCTAHNGLGHPDTRSIMLNVRCPPKTTVNETMNMTIDGIVFMLEAYPVPHEFSFTYLDKGTITKGSRVSSDNFHSTCQQDRDKEYILNCSIKPVYVPKRLRGMYLANVSNGIGSVEVAFEIRIVGWCVYTNVSHVLRCFRKMVARYDVLLLKQCLIQLLNGKSTSTGLIVGCVIIVIIVILVVLVAVLPAKNRRRLLCHQRACGTLLSCQRSEVEGH